MKTLRLLMLTSLLGLVAACGADVTDDPVYRAKGELNDSPTQPGGGRTSYRAELSEDGESYCAVEKPDLCISAKKKEEGFACRSADGDSYCGVPPCVCCWWDLPVSHPFVIRCRSY